MKMDNIEATLTFDVFYLEVTKIHTTKKLTYVQICDC